MRAKELRYNRCFGGRGNTNYEFSTSNPMWRASLEILDFLPMTTVEIIQVV